MKNVCSIIVAYKPNVTELSKLVEQLSINTYVIVAWNEADGMSVDFPNAFNIHFQKNIGLAAAQNKALGQVRALKSQRIFLFDQDSVVTDNYIRGMLSFLDAHQSGSVVSVSPAIIDKDTLQYHLPIIENIFGFPVKGDAKRYSEIFIGINSGLLIDLEVASSNMYFDEKLFIDHVDTEWFLRTRKAGLHHLYNPAETIYHTIGESSFNIGDTIYPIHNSDRKIIQYRNLLYIILNINVSLSWKIKEIFLLIPKVAIFGLKTGQFKSSFLNLYRAIWLVINDNMGKLK